MNCGRVEMIWKPRVFEEYSFKSNTSVPQSSHVPELHVDLDQIQSDGLLDFAIFLTEFGLFYIDSYDIFITKGEIIQVSIRKADSDICDITVCNLVEKKNCIELHSAHDPTRDRRTAGFHSKQANVSREGQPMLQSRSDDVRSGRDDGFINLITTQSAPAQSHPAYFVFFHPLLEILLQQHLWGLRATKKKSCCPLHLVVVFEGPTSCTTNILENQV